MTTQQRLEVLESAFAQLKADDDRILDTLDTVVEVLSLLVVGQRQIERKIVSLDVDVTMVKAVMEGEEVHGY